MSCCDCPYRLKCLVLGWTNIDWTQSHLYPPYCLMDYEDCHYKHLQIGKKRRSDKSVKCCCVCGEVFMAYGRVTCSSRCYYVFTIARGGKR